MDYTPEPFTSLQRAVIAVYWADGDIRLSGNIYFRITQHVDDISQVQSLLSTSFQLTSFDPILIFVATYSNIPQTFIGNHLIKMYIIYYSTAQ